MFMKKNEIILNSNLLKETLNDENNDSNQMNTGIVAYEWIHLV
jgi:hypothetical protein